MPLIQLSVELTRLVSKRTVDTVTANVIKFARDLQKAGSDILVEEDLAAIFGRGKIDSKLELHFKDAVRNLGETKPVYQGGPILLSTQPGPTTQRAIKDSYYMATLIQLSMLLWFHEKTSLSAALVECMHRRFDLNVADANADASYSGILGTLTTIRDETGAFPWTLYVGLIEVRLPASIESLARQHSQPSVAQPFVDNFLMCLPPAVLLAAMDYLYLVQSLPQDRVMRVQHQNGLIPLIIWAHYILGLTVVVQGSPDGNVKFGDEAVANVIVDWSRDFTREDDDDDDAWFVFLLDANMEVVLQTPSDSLSTTTIDVEERLRLEGYATTTLRRTYNRRRLIAYNDPVYCDSAQMATAMAISMSFKLFRRHFGSTSDVPNDLSYSRPEIWRIFEAAQILFSGIEIDRKMVDKWAQEFADVCPSELRLPAALKNFLVRTFEDEQTGIWSIIISYAVLILTFAHVADVQSCVDLPIRTRYGKAHLSPYFSNALFRWDGRKAIEVKEETWFHEVKGYLIGFEAANSSFLDEHRLFLVSEYRWSIYLSNFGDIDPSKVELDLIQVRRGVPVNTRTNERKRGIQDAPQFSDNPPEQEIVEDSGPYLPRCLSKVVKRVEQYSGREQVFWHSCRFDVDESSHVQDSTLAKFSMHASYRLLHRGLWGTLQLHSCEHNGVDIDESELNLDEVTVKGFYWGVDGPALEPSPLEERICILLVAGDPRARWLAIAGLKEPDEAEERQVLLRGEGCCGNCAVKKAATMPGKWLVIL